MVGTKWAYFDNGARNHSLFLALKKEQVEQLKGSGGKGLSVELVALSGRCVMKYTPRMRSIQRDALAGAEQQGTFEFVNYLQGFQQGLGFIRHVVRRAKNPTGKREADASRRAYYSLAAIFSQAIDEVKGELTWGELGQKLSGIVKYTLELELETVKKSLQKAGLKVGKVESAYKRNREEEWCQVPDLRAVRAQSCARGSKIPEQRRIGRAAFRLGARWGKEELMRRRQIPFMKLGHRTVRFYWPAGRKGSGKVRT